MQITDALLKIFGWKASLFFGDPTTADRYRWLKRHLRGGNLRTLDAGCGTGAFTLYAAKLGNYAVGVSFDAGNMRKASHRAELLALENAQFEEGDLRTIEEVIGADEVFDQIICFECLEHIFDDTKVVRELASRLAPGGRLFLTTPFIGYRGLVGDDPARLSKVEDGGHVRWGYSHGDLRKLCEAHGLEVKVEEYVSGVVTQQLTNLLRLADRRLPHTLAWALTFPLRALKVFDHLGSSMLNYPYLSVAIVAEKPLHAQAAKTTSRSRAVREERPAPQLST